MKGKAKRTNIYFRQTARQFAAEKQNQLYEHFNKNLSYKLYAFSKRQFQIQMSKLKNGFNKIKLKLPKSARRKEI